MIKIISEKKTLSESELTQIFNLLKHPLRRTILKLLADSPQAYSKILKKLNLPESSFLNYHLREMGDLLIHKNSEGKYELNETGRICLQLTLKVKEKEDVPRLAKIQKFLSCLRALVTWVQITFLVFICILILELFLLDIIQFSSILEIFVIGIGFATIMAAGIGVGNKEKKGEQGLKISKREKIAIYSTILSIWMLVQTIIQLLLN